jgi:UDP-galactopyranose mutase
MGVLSLPIIRRGKSLSSVSAAALREIVEAIVFSCWIDNIEGYTIGNMEFCSLEFIRTLAFVYRYLSECVLLVHGE